MFHYVHYKELSLQLHFNETTKLEKYYDDFFFVCFFRSCNKFVNIFVERYATAHTTAQAACRQAHTSVDFGSLHGLLLHCNFPPTWQLWNSTRTTFHLSWQI